MGRRKPGNESIHNTAYDWGRRKNKKESESNGVGLMGQHQTSKNNVTKAKQNERTNRNKQNAEEEDEFYWIVGG